MKSHFERSDVVRKTKSTSACLTFPSIEYYFAKSVYSATKKSISINFLEKIFFISFFLQQQQQKEERGSCALRDKKVVLKHLNNNYCKIPLKAFLSIASLHRLKKSCQMCHA